MKKLGLGLTILRLPRYSDLFEPKNVDASEVRYPTWMSWLGLHSVSTKMSDMPRVEHRQSQPLIAA